MGGFAGLKELEVDKQPSSFINHRFWDGPNRHQMDSTTLGSATAQDCVTQICLYTTGKLGVITK